MATVHFLAATTSAKFEPNRPLTGGDHNHDAKANGRRGPERGKRKRRHDRAVAAAPFGQPVVERWRAGLDRLVAKITLDVPSEIAGRLITPRTVLPPGPSLRSRKSKSRRKRPLSLAGSVLRCARRPPWPSRPKVLITARWAAADHPRGSCGEFRRRPLREPARRRMACRRS